MPRRRRRKGKNQPPIDVKSVNSSKVAQEPTQSSGLPNSSDPPNSSGLPNDSENSLPNDTGFFFEAFGQGVHDFLDDMFSKSWEHLSYDYEQTKTEVKITVNMDDIGFPYILTTIDRMDFRERSLLLVIKGPNTTLLMSLPHLAGEIDPKESKYVWKPGKIVLTLRKRKLFRWNSLNYFHPSILRNFESKLREGLTFVVENFRSYPSPKAIQKIKTHAEFLCTFVIDICHLLEKAEFTIPSHLRKDEEKLISWLEFNSRSHEGCWTTYFAVALLLREIRLSQTDRAPKQDHVIENTNTSSRPAQKAAENGKVHFRARRFKDAADSFTRAIELDSECSLYYVNRAIVYFHMKVPNKTFCDIVSALKLDPFNAKAYLYLGKTFLLVGFTNKAKFCFDRAKILNFELPGLDDNILKLYVVEDHIVNLIDAITKNEIDAVGRFLLLITNVVPSPNIMRKIIEELCKKDLIEGAKSVIDQISVIPLQITIGECWYLWGHCAYFEDDEDAVHKNFSKYLDFFPQNYHALKRYSSMKDIYYWRHSGDQVLASGQVDHAIECYFKGNELNLQLYASKRVSANFVYKMGMAKMSSNKGEALSYFNRVLKLVKNHHAALAARAQCWFDMVRYEQGLLDIEEALAIHSCESYKDLSKRIKQRLSQRFPIKRDNELNYKNREADAKRIEGNHLFQKGKYLDAMKAYNAAIKLNPQESIYFSNRSACHFALKNFKEALKDCQSALKFNPANNKALFRLGKCHVACGQPAEALASLEKAMACNYPPTGLNAEMKRAQDLKSAIAEGEACFREEDYSKAEQHFTIATSLAEHCEAIHLKRIECLYWLEKYEDVISALNSSSLDQQDPYFYYFKGLCCYQKGEEIKSLNLIERAVSLDPSQTKFKNTLERIRRVYELKRLGNEAFSENRFDEALAHYSQGLAVDNSNRSMKAVFRFNIGMVHSKMGKLKMAIDAFSSAIEFKKDYVKAYLNRARSYADSAFYEEAAEDYATLSKLSPCPEHEELQKRANEDLKTSKEGKIVKSFADCKVQIAKKSLLEGEHEKAFQCFSEAISICPKSPLYYSHRCECLMIMRKFVDALNDAKKSIELDGGYVEGHILVGKCNMSLGKAEDAVTAFETARKLDSCSQIVVPEILKALRLIDCLKEANSALNDENHILAAEQFAVASAIAVGSLDLLVLRLQSLLSLHRLSEVLEILESIAPEMKTEPVILCTKSKVLYYQDQKDFALDSLNSAFAIDPSNKEAGELKKQIEKVYKLKEQGNKYFGDLDYEQAALCYNEALEIIDLDNRTMRAKLYFNLGILSLHQHCYVDAIKSFNEALEIDKYYIKALAKRAKCYRQTNDYEEALEDYRNLCNLTSSEIHCKLLRETLRQLEKSYAKNHYHILGLTRNSSLAEIKSAYKTLALKFHPDRLNTKADKIVGENKFKLIAKAHAVLTDPFSRECYDRQIFSSRYWL